MGDNSDNNSHNLNDDHDHDYHYDGRLAPRTTVTGRSDKEAKTMQVASSGLFGMSFYYFTIYLLTRPFLGNNYHRQDGLLAPIIEDNKPYVYLILSYLDFLIISVSLDGRVFSFIAMLPSRYIFNLSLL